MSESPDIKTLIKAIRKTEHNFACYLLKQEVFFEADRRRPPEALRRKAKEAGASPKGTLGTVFFEGPAMVLRCQEEPPGTLRKFLKKHLTAEGVKCKVVIELADGSRLDDVEEGEEGAASGAEAAEAPSAPDRRPIVMKAFGAVKPEVQNLLKVASPENRQRLQKLVQAFGTDMKGGNTDRAEKIVTMLKSQVDQIKKARAEGSRRRQGELAEMKKRAGAVMERLERLRSEGRAA